ncbi:suppressor of npr1-1 [Spatholobus suberectus]|nr:suppressor of npr1-1 [Spatholobus suberectus]
MDVRIHESVGSLDKLEIMNFEGCSNLWTFPPLELTSLEYLNLSHCSSLKSFPEILGKMENITHLSLEYTAITKLPYSIGYLIRLQRLELHSCGMVQLPTTIATLPELEELSIWQCEGLQASKQDKDVEKLPARGGGWRSLELEMVDIAGVMVDGTIKHDLVAGKWWQA